MFISAVAVTALCSLAVLCMQSADASHEAADKDITYDGIVYTTLDALGNVTVKDCSENKELSGKVVIPSVFEYDGETYSVTQIAANAFKDDTGITGVSVGSNVSTAGAIGASAFSGCTSLIQISLYHTTGADVRSDSCFKTGNGATVVYHNGSYSYSMNGTYDTATNTYSEMHRINIPDLTDGEIDAVPARVAPGDVAVLEVTPESGFVLSTVSGVYNSSYSVVFLTRTSSSLTFVMPAYDVTISATFSDSYYSVDFYESASRTTVQNVQRFHSILLPVPMEQPGYTFRGWYADSSHETYIGPANGAYTPKASTMLYAYFTAIPMYDASYTYYLDGSVSSRSVIETEYSISLTVPDTFTEGKTGYIVIPPSASYSVSVSSTDVFISGTSSGLYTVEPREDIEDVSITIAFGTLHQGIGSFEITGMTEGLRGVTVRLEAHNTAGLMEGAVHFSGVYYRIMGAGDSAVRVYGAITDTSLERQISGSSYTALTSAGIAVVSGDSEIKENVRLIDGDRAIASIYASYTYDMDGDTTVLTQLMVLPQPDLTGGD